MSDGVDSSNFVGYLGRYSKKAHESRVYQRFKFLRDHFGLSDDEAQKLAISLEKWWGPRRRIDEKE